MMQEEQNSLPMQLSSQDMSIMIGEMDGLYQKGVLAYTKGVHQFKQEILKQKNLLQLKKDAIREDEKKLESFLYELGYDEKNLQKKQLEFLEKIRSIHELKSEYASLLDEGEYQKILDAKSKNIYALEDEIEELEMALLQKELERINLVEKLTPLRLEIQKLEDAIAELEFDKNHFESVALHQVSPVQSGAMKLLQKEREVIETEIEE